MVFGLLPCVVNAQSTNEQLWFEYIVNYSFANSFNLENAFKYSTLLNTPRWYAFEFTPTLDYSLTNNIDISLSTALEYTAQTESINTFEVRPVLGTRIHITPNSRVLTRVFIRLEQRNIQNLDTKDWDNAWRPRFRSSADPHQQKSFFDDKLWYGLFDAEWFLTAHDDVGGTFCKPVSPKNGHRVPVELYVAL